MANNKIDTSIDFWAKIWYALIMTNKTARNAIRFLLISQLLACGAWAASQPITREKRPSITISTLVLIAGNTADVLSSRGHVERNSLMRSADGRFGARGATIKVGVVLGAILGEHMILRHHPRAARLFNVVNFTWGGMSGAVAIRNHQIQTH